MIIATKCGGHYQAGNINTIGLSRLNIVRCVEAGRWMGELNRWRLLCSGEHNYTCVCVELSHHLLCGGEPGKAADPLH